MLEHPDARRRHVEPVGLPPLDDLRVPGRDGHAGAVAAAPIERTISRSSSIGKPFLEHEAGRQPERPGAGDREVVHGAVHCKLTDVAAGKTNGWTT